MLFDSSYFAHLGQNARHVAMIHRIVRLVFDRPAEIFECLVVTESVQRPNRTFEKEGGVQLDRNDFRALSPLCFFLPIRSGTSRLLRISCITEDYIAPDAFRRWCRQNDRILEQRADRTRPSMMIRVASASIGATAR